MSNSVPYRQAVASTRKAPCPTTFWLIADQLNARTEDERRRYIHAGFPPNWIKAVREAFSLCPQRLSQLLNASTSTLERRQRHQQPLDLVSSERMDRVADIALQASRILGDQRSASQWMMARNPALNDQPPIKLCETEIGARQIRRVLAAMPEQPAGQRWVSTTTLPRTLPCNN
ncbi:antitoxin Xre/MbcA/ParS toxin-binding domain-containing protein [Pseudomonas huanghezhanensis]|uniref:antitoxin Xre/MbcA/ParS toxin-binding domain-containing protein n=1 Tax=Pseudomonas huanghezhanensis TaxID=3002903 RepID=UPI002286B067|nr:antitoxin Xre/MbcA/ParS toxin-binding domain-containing protein [Pseudomonas sp. BSw22131]